MPHAARRLLQLTDFQRPLLIELAKRLESLDLRRRGRRLYFGRIHTADSIKEVVLLQIELIDIGRSKVHKTAPLDVRGSPEAAVFFQIRRRCFSFGGGGWSGKV